MQVVVDSLLTHYEVQGNGSLVLILHGWGDNLKGLVGLQRDLSRHYRVLAVDLPGFGGSESPAGAWGLDEYSTFIAHFLRKLGENPPHLLIGHSNGGAIAIRGLAKGLLEADKLVLLSSAGIRGEYKGRVRALRYIAKAGKAMTLPLPKKVKQSLRKTAYSTIGSDMLVAEHLQASFKKIVTDDVRKDAATLIVPTLLLYGENDTATPVVFGEILHQAIDGSTLEVLPGAGHFIHLDRPHDVVRAIEDFA